MKMMRLLSSRARQNVTYLCQNSIAWSDSKNHISDKTMKVLTDDEVELYGYSKNTDINLTVVVDGCKVSSDQFFFRGQHSFFLHYHMHP